MEDVKEHGCIEYGKLDYLIGFNPCFNGRCKRTCNPLFLFTLPIQVSILVLMEDVKEQETTRAKF